MWEVYRENGLKYWKKEVNYKVYGKYVWIFKQSRGKFTIEVEHQNKFVLIHNSRSLPTAKTWIRRIMGV